MPALPLQLLVLGALASLAHALTITSPATGTAWAQNAAQTITWTQDTTDPATVTINLVNTDATAFPTGLTQALGTGVAVADLTFAVAATNIATLTASASYTVQFLDGTTQAVLATSPAFTISATGAAVASSASSSSVSSTTSTSSAPSSSADSTSAGTTTTPTSTSSRTTTTPYTGSSTMDRSTNVFNSAKGLEPPSVRGLMAGAFGLAVMGAAGVLGGALVL